ncbi:hypothetical protein AgCh_032522 [Apium graveolens]
MEKVGNVRYSMKGHPGAQEASSKMGMGASLIAAASAAAMSSPASMALVDERLSTEGTGLPFGLSNNLLGWILFGMFGLIWSLYFVYTSGLDEDEESGLSLFVAAIAFGYINNLPLVHTLTIANAVGAAIAMGSGVGRNVETMKNVMKLLKRSTLNEDEKYLKDVLINGLHCEEWKLKAFRNASELVGQYHEKNKPCANIDIGLDYDALNNKKKNISDKGKVTENENVPAMLKKVGSPLFKACEVNFSEEELIIKQEITDEDSEKKSANSTQSSKTEENLKDNQSTKTPVKEIKIEDARKKKKNRNGKIGINKSNNFAYVADAPRKTCEK